MSKGNMSKSNMSELNRIFKENFYSKGDYVYLKSWEEIEKIYPSEIFNLDEEVPEYEIYIKEDGVYIYEDTKEFLGQMVQLTNVSHITGLNERYSIKETDIFEITPFMILRPANEMDEPECFI